MAWSIGAIRKPADHKPNHEPITSVEMFYCENLQRLRTSSRMLATGGAPTVNYFYDAAGRFTVKSDYASLYRYDRPRPNVVTSVDCMSSGDPGLQAA